MSSVKSPFAGVHVTGPTVRVHTNLAYVVNKPVRYAATIMFTIMTMARNANGPTVRAHTNIAYVVNKSVRYVAILTV